MQVTIFEHGCLHREVVPSCRAECLTVSESWKNLYERLHRADKRRPARERVFAWMDDHAKAGSLVGVVQVPGLMVEILPKIEKTTAARGGDRDTDNRLSRMNLLYMLGVSGMVPMREADLADLRSSRSSLLDAIILLFARRMKQELLRGAHHAYVRHEENQFRLRGRLQFSRHIALNAAHRERFYCGFEEFSMDTSMNRVFKATCTLLHARVHNAAVQDALRHCLMLLDPVTLESNPVPLLDQVLITRQNERFRDLFAFCRMVLRDLSPTPRSGAEHTFSLLFDMNVLFEAFIERFLRRYVIPEIAGSSLHVQGKGDPRYLMRRSGERKHDPILRLKPDLRIEWAQGTVILDTKWKTIWPKDKHYEKVSGDDLYQMFAYTHRYQVQRSILLFPKSRDIPVHLAPSDGVMASYQLLAGPGNKPDPGKYLDVAFVDLSRDFPRSRSSLANELKRIICRETVDPDAGPELSESSIEPSGPSVDHTLAHSYPAPGFLGHETGVIAPEEDQGDGSRGKGRAKRGPEHSAGGPGRRA